MWMEGGGFRQRGNPPPPPPPPAYAPATHVIRTLDSDPIPSKTTSYDW